MKKLLAYLLVFCMVFSLLPITAAAAEVASGTWGNNITWVITQDGALVISGEGEVEETYTSNYPWYAYAAQIKNVIFEEGVNNVPASIFDYNYTSLTSAEIKSVKVIGDYAFASCFALVDVTLPGSLESIGDGAFSDTAIASVELPDGVTSIGTDTFAFCANLKMVVLPDSLAEWDRLAFGHCTALESINIPAGVTSIPSSLFYNSMSLKYIEIPGNVTMILPSAFSGAGLEEIKFLGDAPELFDGCFEDVIATAYYPAGNETWTEEVRQNYGGNLTWVPYGGSHVKFTTYTTSLGGNIAMNFYVELSEDLVNDPNAYMQFDFAGKTVKVPLSEGKKSGNAYQFSCPITSKNMTDDITAQVYNDSGAVGESKTMAVDTYCNWVIANYKDEKTVNLMKAMLNYGASAQMLFKYRTDDLANAALAEEDKVLTAVDASAYLHSRTGEEEGIKPSTYTLLLDSETTIRVYFQLTGTKSIEEYTFTVDGVEVQPVAKDGLYYIEKTNIAAHRLDDMHVFTCGDITIHYGGLSYVNQVMTYYTSGTTFDMAVALYNYSQAAEAYSDNS